MLKSNPRLNSKNRAKAEYAKHTCPNVNSNSSIHKSIHMYRCTYTKLSIKELVRISPVAKITRW